MCKVCDNIEGNACATCEAEMLEVRRSSIRANAAVVAATSAGMWWPDQKDKRSIGMARPSSFSLSGFEFLRDTHSIAQ